MAFVRSYGADGPSTSIKKKKTIMASSVVQSSDVILPVPPSAELALTEQYPPTKFSTLKNLKKTVASAHDKLNEGDESHQYLSFSHVSPKQLESIEAHRHDLGGVRLTYFGDIETLIIKVISEAHERAHLTLGQRIFLEVVAMQIRVEEFTAIGSTRYRGQTASSKESDSGWKNLRVRSNTGDWPSLIIEAGMSESLPRLRSDARWWLEHSAGNVRIVLLVWIQPTIRTVQIEKWVTGPMPPTRVITRRVQSNAFPIRTAEIKIDQSTTPPVINGAPLTLEFDKVFDRPANAPNEHDVVFNGQDLAEWASWLWVGL